MVNPIDHFDTVEKHIREFFADHSVTEHQWPFGPVHEAMPEFRVLCAAPGNHTPCWTYLSVGASSIENKELGLLEFFIISPVEHLRNVELVTMAAWYHKTNKLGHGHTFPIGEPWLEDSHCDHMLISTPYPFGPDLEICNCPNGHIHLFWLLPITEAERDYKVAHGLESLEQLFEDAGLEYWNVSRPSVIQS